MAEASNIGRILLVDDEEYITDLLKLNLEAEHYAVSIINVAARVAAVDLNDFCLMVVDAMTQRYSGFDLLRDIKSNPVTSHVPVIMLTHIDSEDSIISAFDMGADDYILKPFSLREFVARVRSVLRRHTSSSIMQRKATVLQAGCLKVDVVTRQVSEDGMLLPLTKTEYAILVFLLRNKNHFFNRAQIYEEVWRDAENTTNARIVDTNISRLRKKLGESAEMLVNRSGQGYAIVE